MGKLSKTIEALGAIIRNPWLLNVVLADDSLWWKKLERANGIKNPFPVVDLFSFLGDEEQVLEPWAFLDGSSMPTDIALLKALAKRFNECSYFEIGTWRGESVANVASVAKECFTLNLSREEIMARGFDPRYADLHAHFSKELSNVKHLYGDTSTFNFSGLNKKFDLIFIDGDHSYPFVKSDTEKVFEHLIHDKSIVVWHDYAHSPERIRPEVMMGILEGVPEKFHSNLYHASNSMCAVFIREDFKIEDFQSPVKPTNNFRLKIKKA